MQDLLHHSYCFLHVFLPSVCLTMHNRENQHFCPAIYLVIEFSETSSTVRVVTNLVLVCPQSPNQTIQTCSSRPPSLTNTRAGGHTAPRLSQQQGPAPWLAWGSSHA